MSDIETTVDCDIEIRLVIQFDAADGWHYFLNGVEISLAQYTAMKLPFQNPD